MSKLKIFNQLQDWLDFRKSLNGTLGFVPTMGALHKGHTSLVNQCVLDNDFSVVSIYLNPTQFNDKNDLKKYPSTLEDDIKKLEEAGCDYLILPNYKEIYPDNYSYVVSEKTLSKSLCGAKRLGHFDGVLTVVMKLLNIVEADNAYFGKKDFQQYILVKRMVEAFFIKTSIIGCETVREQDGLALSSRNALLTSEQRKLAPLIFKTLDKEKDNLKAKQSLEKNEFKVDYIEEVQGRRFAAAYLGDVRLIDNIEV